MVIAIEGKVIKNIDKFIRELELNHKDKIYKILRGGSTIRLINGDVIKILKYSYDGFRADVAIGEEVAVHLTRFSEEEKPIWTLEDLDNYLKDIEVNKKQGNSMSVKIEVDTTELDLALDKLKSVEKTLENIIKLQQKSFSSPMPNFNNEDEWLKHNPKSRIIKVNQPNYAKPER